MAWHGSLQVLDAYDQAKWEKAALDEQLLDPFTYDLMVDPVQCSDGRVHCRFVAFTVIDNRNIVPGCDTFEILGENAAQL